jgi:hypothetical protein
MTTFQPGSTEDAREVASDAEARFFPFRLSLESLLVLEKRTIPEHLSTMDCLDTPTAVETVLRELEDMGEVAWVSFTLK